MSFFTTTAQSTPTSEGLGYASEPRMVRPVGHVGIRRPILWMTALTLVLFAIWATNAPLDEVTRGNGKVIPISRGQIIQSLEGGILQFIHVLEGDEVEAGQRLAEIDDTAFRVAYTDLNGQAVALRASLTRLRAELAGASQLVFEPEVAAAIDIVEVETQLFQARQKKFRETIEILNEKLALSRKHLELLNPLVKSGATSKVEEIRIEREVTDLSGELSEAANVYYQEITDEISKKSTELYSVQQRLEEKKDALSRTELRSPVHGIVKDLSITTRGGVIKPGETIMEIVPLDDQLFVEAEVKPRDVAFLHVGQPATVKITAYDSAVYGYLKGELVFISADTIKDEMRKDSEPFYRVRVLTDSASLNGPDGPLPIKPGMIAEVDIQTGSKTVLNYLLNPILRSQDAMKER